MERILGIMSLGFSSDARAVLAAMSKSQAIIEFDLTGKILSANPNFCAALGYELSEIVGQHHRMFVDPAEASSAEYRQFWSDLAAGKFDQRQYKRIGKGGKEIWIEGSYNPVFKGGRPYKVVKFATDITTQKLKSAEDAGKLDALWTCCMDQTLDERSPCQVGFHAVRSKTGRPSSVILLRTRTPMRASVF